MNEFFAYLMESTVCMLIFWAVYLILLRRTTFFRLNRLYLIMSLIISMIIPLISIPTEQSNSLQLRPQMQSLANEIVVSQIEPINNISVQNIQVDNPQVEVSDNVNYGVIAYSFVSLLLFLFYSYSIFRIFRLHKNSQIMEIKGLQVAVSNQDNVTPFSFLKTFYFSKKLLLNSDFDHIIEHEAGHIKHLHSLDLIGICILKSIFWCNPMIYIIEKSLKENHEFTADKIVIKKGVQPRYYKELLLRSTYADLFSAPVNSFSMSIIKKRFNMLDKNNSSRKSLIKYAAFLPILALLIAMFACGRKNNGDSTKITYSTIRLIESDTIGCHYNTKGEKIDYSSARTYLLGEMRDSLINLQLLPKAAFDAGITNAVVNVSFIVDTNGSVIFAKAENAKKLNEKWQSKLGYGIDSIAESLVRNFKLTQVKNPYGIPSLHHSMVMVHFGDYEVWQGAEGSHTSITTLYSSGNQEADYNQIANLNLSKVLGLFNNNLQYPKSQIQNNISGRVIVSFVVTPSGKIIKPKIESGINEAFDTEAKRVLDLLVKSDLYIGKANNSIVKLPIVFALK